MYVASLIALTLSAASARAGEPGDLLALAGPAPASSLRDSTLGGLDTVPSHGVLESAQGALAPAPDKVVRQTRSFGTVTIDHGAHLARRSACKTCHGPGPVTKLEFTPKVAHERCIGCHREQQRGPMKCRECHILKEKPAELADPGVQVASALAPGVTMREAMALVKAPAAAGGAPSSAAKLGGPSAPGGAPIPGPVPPAEGGAASDTGFTRVLGIGCSVSSGPGRSASAGPAFTFDARDGDLLLLLSVERSGGTLGVLGVGAIFPIHRSFNFFLTGLVGFDAVDQPQPSMMPAIGARAGVEWLGSRTSVALAVTGVSDLTRSTTALGEQLGGFTASVGVTAGIVLGKGR
jgi:hypothetical protein